MPPRSAPAIGRGAIASIAVVATPRDASKQGGQDPVRTLSAAAIVIAAALRILLAQSPFPLLAANASSTSIDVRCTAQTGPSPSARAANVVSTP